jgi:hypothetical protein
MAKIIGAEKRFLNDEKRITFFEDFFTNRSLLFFAFFSNEEEPKIERMKYAFTHTTTC